MKMWGLFFGAKRTFEEKAREEKEKFLL